VDQIARCDFVVEGVMSGIYECMRVHERKKWIYLVTVRE